MEIKKFLEEASSKLKAAGIEECEAEWILCHFLDIKRSEIKLIRNAEHALIKRAAKVVEKRIKTRKPLDLIFKTSNFYGRDFLVNRHVLKPRFETENLVYEALKAVPNNGSVLDLCTGPAVAAISMALEKPYLQVFASDIDGRVLKLARKNAARHHAKITFIKSDLFKNIERKFSLIVCNPPYIKTDEISGLQPEVKKYDPHLALDGGEDGLNFYRLILQDANKHLTSGGKILFEVGASQAAEVVKIAEESSKFRARIIKDYAGIERIVFCELQDNQTVQKL